MTLKPYTTLGVVYTSHTTLYDPQNLGKIPVNHFEDSSLKSNKFYSFKLGERLCWV